MNNISEHGPNTAVEQVIRGAGALARWSRHLRYYGVAVLFVAMAALLRWSLPQVPGPTPFLAFYLAWVAAAALGGLGPGLLATTASWLCVDLLFDSTPWQTTFSGAEESACARAKSGTARCSPICWTDTPTAGCSLTRRAVPRTSSTSTSMTLSGV